MVPHTHTPSMNTTAAFYPSLMTTVAITFLLLLLLPCHLQKHLHAHAAQPSFESVPSLNGRHFKITVLEENGFLDILEDADDDDDDDDHNDPTTYHNIHRSYHDNLRRVRYQGYLIDMIHSLAEKANFTFTLLPPSGMGSACVPRIHSTTNDVNNNNSNPNASLSLYDKIYRTQYNCGASDVNDYTMFLANHSDTLTGTSTTNSNNHNLTTTTTTTTDMYLGMYYVSPARQLINHFTIPFLPPFSGTLAMFGTATHIVNFPSLVIQQQQQQQQNTTHEYDSSLPTATTVGVQVTTNTTCGPAGTALIHVVQEAYPGLTVRGIYVATPDELFQHFYNGSCTVYISDGPIAAQFVLLQSRKQQEQQQQQQQQQKQHEQQPNPCTDQHGNVRKKNGVVQRQTDSPTIFIIIVMVSLLSHIINSNNIYVPSHSLLLVCITYYVYFNQHSPLV
jgi:hypothetical protein